MVAWHKVITIILIRLLCLSASVFSPYGISKNIIPTEFQSLFVCFLTKYRHGLCRGFRGAEACLSGKPLKITTWEILSLKQSLSHGKTLHEKQYSESLAASHRQKYALLMHCFVLHQSQHNPTLFLIRQNHIIGMLAERTSSPSCKTKEPLMRCDDYVMSVLINSKERSTTFRAFVKTTQLSKSPMLQTCPCQQLDHRLAKTVQSKMWLLKIPWVTLWSEIEIYLIYIFQRVKSYDRPVGDCAGRRNPSVTISFLHITELVSGSRASRKADTVLWLDR